MRIRDLLRSKGETAVATLHPDATVRDLLAALADHGVGALVVSLDGRTIAGIASERDVVRHLHQQGPALLDQPVSAIMTAEVQTCAPGDSVDDLARAMTSYRIRHVPVVVDDALAGIVSIGDVVKARIDELETERSQLVGYITQS